MSFGGHLPQFTGWHIGRSFGGPRDLEHEDTLCEKASCGLVAVPHPDCDQHHFSAMKTIRTSHRAEDCPGAPDDLE